MRAKKKTKTPVGYKISKLVHSGVPQRQAVAIALNMRDRGQLGPRGGYIRRPKTRLTKSKKDKILLALRVPDVQQGDQEKFFEWDWPDSDLEASRQCDAVVRWITMGRVIGARIVALGRDGWITRREMRPEDILRMCRAQGRYQRINTGRRGVKRNSDDYDITDRPTKIR